MYCGSRPKPPQIAVGNSDHPSPPPISASMNIRPLQTEAQETKPSRNFATMRDSPLGVSSLFGSFRGAGRDARRRSGRPPPDIRAGGAPSRVSAAARRPTPPPLVRRDGRYGGALRDSRARRSASAVDQHTSSSFSSERMTHADRSSGHVG